MKELCKIETPFPEKFGVPRQPLIPEAMGKMVFPKNDFYSEAFRGLENVSHLWLIFEFNLVDEGSFNALVRPPRFDGKKKLGVFATRSPHRPNRLGLSAVKFERIEILEENIVLWVSGVDLVHGTPILDIKPYIPYVDSIPSATCVGFETAPIFKKVNWECEKPEAYILIEKVIALDPRPGHDKSEHDVFGVSVAGVNIRFKEVNNEFVVLEVR